MSKSFNIWHHIRRSPYQTILAISITSLTFFVVTLVSYAALVSSTLLTYFEQKPQITAFFSDEKKEDSIKALQDKLKGTGKVSGLRFVSKDEALKIYQNQNKSDPLLLEMVTADILPASLEISTTEPKFLADVATILQQESGINETIYQKDIVDTLLTWTATIRYAGILLIIFFFLLTILVTLTITGMKIILRREEIEILKLVGATRSYISKPFIIEGMLYGFIGAIIGWLLGYGVLLYATPFLSSLLQGIPALSLHIAFFGKTIPYMREVVVWPISIVLTGILLFLLTFLGLLLGALGSFVALWRYVRF